MKWGVAGRQRGLTLIELIMFIIIVGVGLAGVLTVFNVTARSSADPVVRKQALAIAEAMLEEILSKSYENDAADPGNTSTTLGCTPNTNPTCVANTPAQRSRYNDVDDYNGWNQNGVFDLNGAALAGLANYRVVVAVAAPAAFGVAGSQVTGKQVTVTVTGGAESVALTGFRANF